jgi:phage-related protein
MAKREYVRHIVAYKDYFKDFKKELPRKSQKTPKAEIEKAKRIMNEYYEQKKQMI